MSIIERFRELLGDDYIVHNYEAKGCIDVCRKYNVLDSETGDDIIIARLKLIHLSHIPNAVKNILRNFTKYDNGGFPELDQGDSYDYFR